MLSKYTQKHIVECFFVENCGISYDSFMDMVRRRWKGPQTSPLAHLERSIVEVRVQLDVFCFCSQTRLSD